MNDKNKQKGKTCTNKFSQKWFPGQLNFKLFTKTFKKIDCVYSFDNVCESKNAHFCDTMKSMKEKQQKGAIGKNHEYFLKTVCTKNKDQFRKMSRRKEQILFQ